jgi:hypothetical protein
MKKSLISFKFPLAWFIHSIPSHSIRIKYKQIFIFILLSKLNFSQVFGMERNEKVRDKWSLSDIGYHMSWDMYPLRQTNDKNLYLVTIRWHLLFISPSNDIYIGHCFMRFSIKISLYLPLALFTHHIVSCLIKGLINDHWRERSLYHHPSQHKICY